MRAFLSILLVVSVLFSSIGFTISNHYCKGNLAESILSVGQSEVGCGMEVDGKMGCQEKPHPNSYSKTPCCADEYLQMKINENYTQITTETATINYSFISAFVISYINLYSFNSAEKLAYLDYPPPFLKQNTQALIQTFLL